MSESRANDIKPVYYLFGEEDYLIEKTLEKIKAKALTKGFESMNHHVYEGGSFDVDSLIQTAFTMPAFSPMRLIVVTNAHKLKAEKDAHGLDAEEDVPKFKAEDAKKLLEYVKAPSASTCLVFIAPVGKLKKDTKFIKYLFEHDYVKEHKRLKEAGLHPWITDYVKKQDKGITKEAEQRLVDISGFSLRGILAELEKIVAFVGAKKTIEEADVAASAYSVNEDNAFDLATAISKHDMNAALRVLSAIDEEPLRIIGAIAWQTRILIKVKECLKNRLSRAESAKTLRISEYRLPGYVEVSRNFSDKELFGVISRLSRADIELKSIKLPGELILMRAIMDVCGAPRKWVKEQRLKDAPAVRKTLL